MLSLSDPSRLFYLCNYSWISNWEGKGGGTSVVGYIIEEKVTRLMSNCAVWKWVQDNVSAILRPSKPERRIGPITGHTPDTSLMTSAFFLKVSSVRIKQYLVFWINFNKKYFKKYSNDWIGQNITGEISLFKYIYILNKVHFYNNEKTEYIKKNRLQIMPILNALLLLVKSYHNYKYKICPHAW